MKTKLGFLLLLALLAYRSDRGTRAVAQARAGQTTSTTYSVKSTAPPKSKSVSSAQGPVVLPKDFSQLRVEAGNLLSVSVYDAPELSDAYRVDPAGELKLPLCDKVKVSGLTLPEVARALEISLKQNQILVEPQVQVDVQQFAGQFVTVLGEVNSPGRIPVIAPALLEEILAEAGGLTAIAGKHIEVRHGPGAGSSVIGDMGAAGSVAAAHSGDGTVLSINSELVRPGDTVFVPRAGIVYVLGAVFHPGGFVMQEDGKLNVAEALALSGGTLLTAKTGGLRVLRKNLDGSISDLRISYDRIASGAEKPIELDAQDIVYVPMSKFKATMTDATAILSAATSAAIYSVR